MAGTLKDIQCFIDLVGGRPWWPIQSGNNERNTKVKGDKEREMSSSLLILELERASSRIRERKKMARRSINCTSLE